jgi:hypothetical protein
MSSTAGDRGDSADRFLPRAPFLPHRYHRFVARRPVRASLSSVIVILSLFAVASGLFASPVTPEEDPVPSDFSLAERKMALELFGRLSPANQANFRACVERKVGHRSALLDRASDGATFLEEVASPFEVAPKGTAGSVLGAELLESCANPGAITQGAGMHNTCTVASIEYLLARDYPAELGRLVHGLVRFGQVRLENGDWMTRVEDSVEPDRYLRDGAGRLRPDPNGTIPDPRKAIDRIFQAALMDYANGSDRYSDKTDLSSGSGLPYTGLYNDQQRKALEAVFNKSYREVRGRKAIAALSTAIRDTPTMVDLEWREGSHAVVVERIADGRVYFKNPLGPWGRALAEVPEPLRRIEDHDGHESMRLEDFGGLFQAAYLP